MKILLTNDDGIFSEGIYAIYQELKKLGEVCVVAPDSERSAVSHAITLAHPIFHKKVKRKGKDFGYGISGTPADCVKLGVKVILKEKPDLVVSGINLGPNDGCSIFYSGTVAGAREGALLGIPSIAVSLDTFGDPDFSYAAKYTVKLAKIVIRKKLPKGTFLNINIPNLKSSMIKGAKTTHQCLLPIHTTFHKRTDPNSRDYYWMSGKMPVRKKNISKDTYALNNGYITITPIRSDVTHYEFLEELNCYVE